MKDNGLKWEKTFWWWPWTGNWNPLRLYRVSDGRIMAEVYKYEGAWYSREFVHYHLATWKTKEQAIKEIEENI